MRRTAVLAAVLLLGAREGEAKTRVGLAPLSIPMSVRQMGMGEMGMGGTDVLRSWANPALLVDQTTKGEAALGGHSLFAGESTTANVGLGWKPAHWLAAGVLVGYNTLSVPEVDATGAETAKSLGQDTYSVGIVGAAGTGLLNVGLAIKMAGESVDGESAGGIALDAGLTLGTPTFRIGASLRNMGPSVWESGGTEPVKEAMPLEVRTGMAAQIWKLGVGAELAAPSGRQASLGAGVEYWLTSHLGLRAGAAGIGGDGGMRITAGLTGVYRGINLDYALGTHELGISNRVAVSYAFWGPAQARPAIDWKALRFKLNYSVEKSPEDSAKAEEAAAKTETTAEKAAEEPARKPEPVESSREKPVAGGINLAVLDLTPQGVSASDASVITDMIRGALVKTGAVNVVEKQNMDKILAEQAFQQTGCTTEECAIKMGKLLNVQRIMVGSFGKLLDKYMVNVRVVNVETGKVVYADSAGGRTTENLEDQLTSLAERVARKLR